MVTRERAVPTEMAEIWKRTTTAADPVAALAASRSMYHQLSAWQGRLVIEALGAGATWEDIGRALNTTRQAAWARFKEVVAVNDKGGERMVDEVQQARSDARAELKALFQRLRDRDQEWHKAKSELRSEVSGLRERARELDHRRDEDRRALQIKIAARKKALDERLRAVKKGSASR